MPSITYTVTEEVSEDFLAAIPDRAQFAFEALIDPYLIESQSNGNLACQMTFSDVPDTIYDFDELRAIYDPIDEEDSDE